MINVFLLFMTFACQVVMFIGYFTNDRDPCDENRVVMFIGFVASVIFALLIGYRLG